MESKKKGWGINKIECLVVNCCIRKKEIREMYSFWESYPYENEVSYNLLETLFLNPIPTFLKKVLDPILFVPTWLIFV